MGCGASSQGRAGSSRSSVLDAVVATTTSTAANVVEVAGEVATEVAERARTGDVAAALAETATGDAANAAVELGKTAGQVLETAGEALLELGKTLPWVAPVAFLIGAVVKAAHDAKVLRADSLAFAVVVRSVESVLMHVGEEGALDDVKEPVDALRGVLEEGLGHCNKLASQSAITAILLSTRDAKRFDDLQSDISKYLQLVTAAASITAVTLQTQQFKQAEELAANVDKLGGADEVAKDPEKLAQLKENMTASEAVMISTITQSEKNIVYKIEAVEEQNAERHAVLEKQIANLTTMMQAVINFKAGAAMKEAETAEGEDAGEEGKKAVDVAEVIDEASSGAAVRLLEQQNVLPADEDERMKVVQELRLDTAHVSDLVDDSDINEIVRQVQQEYGADLAYVGAVDGDAQSYISGYKRVTTDDGSTAEHSLAGLVVPKPTTLCQHTIANDETLVFNQNENEGEPVKRINDLADFMALADAGEPRYAGMMQAFGAVGFGAPPGSVDVPEYIPMPSGKDVLSSGMLGFVSTISDPNKFFASVPIKVKGQTVATMCIVDRKHRDLDALNKTKIELAAKRVAQLIENKRTGGLHPLDDISLAAAVEDKSSDLAVLLVTEGCEFCAKMKVVWDGYASRYSNPRFALYDISTRDAPFDDDAWKVGAVPAAVLTLTDGSVVRYNSTLEPHQESVNKFLKWVRQQGASLQESDASAAAPAAEYEGGSELAIAGDEDLAAASCAIVRKPTDEVATLTHPSASEDMRKAIVPVSHDDGMLTTPGVAEALHRLARAHALQMDALQQMARVTRGAPDATLATVNNVLERQGTEAVAAVQRVADRAPEFKTVARATQHDVAARSIMLYRQLTELARDVPDSTHLILKGFEAASVRLSVACEAQIDDALDALQAQTAAAAATMHADAAAAASASD